MSEAPFDVSWPVIEKECLTKAEEGVEMVRAVVATVTVWLLVFASSAGAAVLNKNAQTTSTAATTITTRFSADNSPHLER